MPKLIKTYSFFSKDYHYLRLEVAFSSPNISNIKIEHTWEFCDWVTSSPLCSFYFHPYIRVEIHQLLKNCLIWDYNLSCAAILFLHWVWVSHYYASCETKLKSQNNIFPVFGCLLYLSFLLSKPVNFFLKPLILLVACLVSTDSHLLGSSMVGKNV